MASPDCETFKNDDAAFLASRLQKGNVVFLTGAGISTESGIPDYRSPATGLWKQFDWRELATPEAIKHRYDQFREFYQFRINVFSTVAPNVGHEKIAKWCEEGRVSGVITQNIDGLHHVDNLIELHGRITRIVCDSCGLQSTTDAFMNNEKCSSCCGKLRPDVVLFGEDLNAAKMQEARRLVKNCTTFVVVGSSLSVFPANSLPKYAKKQHKTVIIVNNEKTDLDWCAKRLVRGSIGEFLSQVDSELEELKSSSFV